MKADPWSIFTSVSLLVLVTMLLMHDIDTDKETWKRDIREARRPGRPTDVQP